MSWAVGALGGVGMLALIGLLILAFLRKAGLLKGETVRTMLRCACMTALVGAGYFLFALLIRFTVYGAFEAGQDIGQALGGPYFHEALNALSAPAFSYPVTGVFAAVAHFLGGILFRQYRLTGFALAYLMTTAALWLLTVRLKTIWNEQAAENAAFLLLCLPGSAFFFLPCGVPLVFLLAGLIFFFLGRKIPPCAFSLSHRGYTALLTVCLCLSAAVICGMADGRIG